MATATSKQRTVRKATAATANLPGPDAATFTFVVFEDNGGDHRWSMLDGAGVIVAQSRAFATHDEAQTGARDVRDGVGPAQIVEAAARG